jgi:hypothetical protein
MRSVNGRSIIPEVALSAYRQSSPVTLVANIKVLVRKNWQWVTVGCFFARLLWVCGWLCGVANRAGSSER